MRVSNYTKRDYFLVFQKLFEFKKICAIASTKDEAIKIRRMLQLESPKEKFIIVKIKSREERV